MESKVTAKIILIDFIYCGLRHQIRGFNQLIHDFQLRVSILNTYVPSKFRFQEYPGCY
jgi:hypothetical protein